MDPSLASIPSLTLEQRSELERSMAEDFGIDPLATAENAARHLAQLTRDRLLAGEAKDKSVIVLAGAGGKGGVALACARRLSGWGANVRVWLLREPDSSKALAFRQVEILRRMKVPVLGPADSVPVEDFDAIVDGTVGVGLRGRPREDLGDAIRWMTAQKVPVVSLELPAGWDSSPRLKATATLALGLPLAVLMDHGAEEHRGELYLGDLGAPEIAHRRLGIRRGPIFSTNDWMRIA